MQGGAANPPKRERERARKAAARRRRCGAPAGIAEWVPHLRGWDPDPPCGRIVHLGWTLASQMQHDKSGYKTQRNNSYKTQRNITVCVYVARRPVCVSASWMRQHGGQETLRPGAGSSRPTHSDEWLKKGSAATQHSPSWDARGGRKAPCSVVVRHSPSLLLKRKTAAALPPRAWLMDAHLLSA